MYLVDSFAGEVIEDELPPFCACCAGPSLGDPPPIEVDFRYSGACLMLFLDGHAAPVPAWKNLCNLERPGGRGIRVRDLDLTRPDPPCPEDP